MILLDSTEISKVCKDKRVLGVINKTLHKNILNNYIMLGLFVDDDTDEISYMVFDTSTNRVDYIKTRNVQDDLVNVWITNADSGVKKRAAVANILSTMADLIAKDRSLRIGQAAYIAAMHVHENENDEFVKAIRGTDADCFDDSKKTCMFLHALFNYWDVI